MDEQALNQSQSQPASVQQSQSQPASVQQSHGFTTLDDLSTEQAGSQSEEYAPTESVDLKKEEKPYNWQKDWRIAGGIAVLGFGIAGVIFYFLFKSAGVI